MVRSSSATLSTLGGILVVGGEALEAAELQTLNQLRNLIRCVDDDDGERQRARERGVYIYTKEERRRAALTAEQSICLE